MNSSTTASQTPSASGVKSAMISGRRGGCSFLAASWAWTRSGASIVNSPRSAVSMYCVRFGELFTCQRPLPAGKA